jgi:hypothetical protein
MPKLNSLSGLFVALTVLLLFSGVVTAQRSTVLGNGDSSEDYWRLLLSELQPHSRPKTDGGPVGPSEWE